MYYYIKRLNTAIGKAEYKTYVDHLKIVRMSRSEYIKSRYECTVKVRGCLSIRFLRSRWILRLPSTSVLLSDFRPTWAEVWSFLKRECGGITRHHWEGGNILKSEELDKLIHTECWVPRPHSPLGSQDIENQAHTFQTRECKCPPIERTYTQT